MTCDCYERLQLGSGEGFIRSLFRLAASLHAPCNLLPPPIRDACHHCSRPCTSSSSTLNSLCVRGACRCCCCCMHPRQPARPATGRGAARVPPPTPDPRRQSTTSLNLKLRAPVTHGTRLPHVHPRRSRRLCTMLALSCACVGRTCFVFLLNILIEISRWLSRYIYLATLVLTPRLLPQPPGFASYIHAVSC